MFIDLNEFLFGVAWFAWTLIGTLIVGVFFYIETNVYSYIETNVYSSLMASDAADRYPHSRARRVLVVYALPLFVALILAASTPYGVPRLASPSARQ